MKKKSNFLGFAFQEKNLYVYSLWFPLYLLFSTFKKLIASIYIVLETKAHILPYFLDTILMRDHQMGARRKKYLIHTSTYPIFTIEKALRCRWDGEVILIYDFIQTYYTTIMQINDLYNKPPYGNSITLEEILSEELITIEFDIPVTKTIEKFPSRTPKVRTTLNVDQEKKMISILRNHIAPFSWDYKDILAIHPSNYTHKIYIKEYRKPII